MTAEVTSGFNPSVRRSVTAPVNRSPASPVRLDDASADPKHAEVLFTHPSTKVFSFQLTKLPGMPRSATEARRKFEEASSSEKKLPWAATSEQLVGFGQMRIDKTPANATFLRVSKWDKLIMYKTQCWCVDGVSKFAMYVSEYIYRIELPCSTEGDMEKVEELKGVFREILQFEKSKCPFDREFTIELLEEQVSPLRNRFIQSPAPSPIADYHRRSRSSGIDGANDQLAASIDPSPTESSGESRYDLDINPTDTSAEEENTMAYRANGSIKLEPTPLTLENSRSITAPSKLLPLDPDAPLIAASMLDTDSGLISGAQKPLTPPPTSSAIATHATTENSTLIEETYSFSSYNKALEQSEPTTPTSADQLRDSSKASLEPPRVLPVYESPPTPESPILDTAVIPAAVPADIDERLAPPLENSEESSASTIPTPQKDPSQVRLRTSASRQKSPATPPSFESRPRRKHNPENRGILATIFFAIYAILMAPPSNLLTILSQLAAKLLNTILSVAGAYRMRGTGPAREPSNRLPGRWVDSDDLEGSSEGLAEEDEDWDEDDYGVPLGNGSPARLRRKRLGGSFGAD